MAMAMGRIIGPAPPAVHTFQIVHAGFWPYLQNMWLGFSAAFIGVLYAVLKFLTAYRLRQLRDQIEVVHHELQKTKQRLETLGNKLQVEHSRKRALEREVGEQRKRLDNLYARLQAVLPQSMLSQLERCRALQAEPGAREFKLLHQLHLVERISQILGSFSLLIARFPTDDEAVQAIAIGAFTRQLEEASIPYCGPEEGEIVCFFERPQAALDLWRVFLAAEPAGRRGLLRGVLCAGVHLTEERDQLQHLLARNLQRARKLLASAAPGQLLLNEDAYQGLENQEGIESCKDAPALYRLSWKEEKDV
jgi:hypothetical protein